VARVLRAQEIRLDGRVVELGPGFSAKIGYGLAEVGFHGEVVLVESVRSRVDLLLANHVLDDLFLSTHLSFRDSDRLFAESSQFFRS
jgi:uncharacterized UPF0146 family protein